MPAGLTDSTQIDAGAQRVTLYDSFANPLSAGMPVAQVSQSYTASVIFPRPADTTAYTANDIVGFNVSTGGGVLCFPNVGPRGQRVFITQASLQIRDTGLISGETSYALYLYARSPGSALGDNVAFDLLSTFDRNAYLPPPITFNPVDLGSTLSDGFPLSQQVQLVDGNLYGYLVTVGAYTPTSQRIFQISLGTLAA